MISQFLSPYFNNRDYQYGGDFDRRLRIALDIIESCRKHVGPDYPLLFRISMEECIPGGRGVEESVKICRKLEEAGINAIDVCNATFQTPNIMFPTVYSEKGAWLNLAEAVKSNMILPKIRNRFTVIEEKPYGGNLLHLIFKDISHNFIEDDYEKDQILNYLIEIEDSFIKTNNHSDFMFGIFSR